MKNILLTAIFLATFANESHAVRVSATFTHFENIDNNVTIILPDNERHTITAQAGGVRNSIVEDYETFKDRDTISYEIYNHERVLQEDICAGLIAVEENKKKLIAVRMMFKQIAGGEDEKPWYTCKLFSRYDE